MTSGRRRFVLGGTALLAGCASSRELPPSETYRFMTPTAVFDLLVAAPLFTAQRFAENMAESLRWLEPSITQTAGGSADWRPSAGLRDKLNEGLRGGWEINLGVHPIAFNYRHLYIIVKSTALDMEYLRLDGVAADPAPKRGKPGAIEFNIQELSVGGGSLLLGVPSMPTQPAIGDDKGDGKGFRLSVFRGNYHDIVNFIETSAALLMQFDTALQPYSLFSTNSNAFVAMALRQGLGTRFDQERIADYMTATRNAVPGFTVPLRLPPGFQPVPLSDTPDTVTGLVEKHLNSVVAADPMRRAISQLTLALAMPLKAIEVAAAGIAPSNGLVPQRVSAASPTPQP